MLSSIRVAALRCPQAQLLHRRALRSTSALWSAQGRVNHTSDTYSKEVDATPPSDHTVHRLDPESDNVQKPHEPPSGYSRAGVKTEEYSSVDYGGKAPLGAKEKGAKSAAVEKGSGGAA
jgi:hypothetical protein